VGHDACRGGCGVGGRVGRVLGRVRETVGHVVWASGRRASGPAAAGPAGVRACAGVWACMRVHKAVAGRR
jgi:hypothetical protein